jgi:hypothetical protein
MTIRRIPTLEPVPVFEDRKLAPVQVFEPTVGAFRRFRAGQNVTFVRHSTAHCPNNRQIAVPQPALSRADAMSAFGNTDDFSLSEQ